MLDPFFLPYPLAWELPGDPTPDPPTLLIRPVPGDPASPYLSLTTRAGLLTQLARRPPSAHGLHPAENQASDKRPPDL